MKKEPNYDRKKVCRSLLLTHGPMLLYCVYDRIRYGQIRDIVYNVITIISMVMAVLSGWGWGLMSYSGPFETKTVDPNAPRPAYRPTVSDRNLIENNTRFRIAAKWFLTALFLFLRMYFGLLIRNLSLES